MMVEGGLQQGSAFRMAISGPTKMVKLATNKGLRVGTELATTTLVGKLRGVLLVKTGLPNNGKGMVGSVMAPLHLCIELPVTC